MADPTNPPPTWTRRSPDRRAVLVIAMTAILAVADVAAAKITLRPHSPHDNFFFHANYSKVPFDPADSFSLEVWNCANGKMPMFLSTGRELLIICGVDPAGNHPPAELVYTAHVPGGSCVNHGRSCYYRNPDIPSTGAGVRYFRVRYATRGRGNRVWIDSYGDLSGANQAAMLLLIKIAGQPRAVLEDVFIPLPNGGWFSRF
jgi:hypothetical protein